MGLDASVYSDDDEEHEIASARIGNSATIGHVLQAIQQKDPSASVLLTKVLYSGSHCGDRLTKEEVRQAKRELDEVRTKLSDDSDTAEFIATFGAIVDTALLHGRPITF